jgi:ribonuclease P protein component
MLPKKFRLRKKNDFDKVYKKGRKITSEFFLIKIKPSGLKFSRIGFVVSKKTAGKIVLRNKLKRRMREIIRLFREELKGGYDIIIVAKPTSLDKNYKDLEIDLKKLLKKENLLINEEHGVKTN